MKKKESVLSKIKNVVYHKYFNLDNEDYPNLDPDDYEKCKKFTKEFSEGVVNGSIFPSMKETKEYTLESRKNDIKKVNPNRNDPIDPEHFYDSSYMSNCVRCVLANELRDRGYDVTAGIAYGEGMTNSQISRLYLEPTLKNDDNFWIATLLESPDTITSRIYKDEYSVINKEDIRENILTSTGKSERSRGYLTFSYEFGGSHIISWKYDKSKDEIIFEDPQVSEVYSESDFMDNELSVIDIDSVIIGRIDNKELNWELINEYAMLNSSYEDQIKNRKKEKVKGR